MMVIKTSKKSKILIFTGVHPGLKFAPHQICSICSAIRHQMPPLFFYNLYACQSNLRVLWGRAWTYDIWPGNENMK